MVIAVQESGHVIDSPNISRSGGVGERDGVMSRIDITSGTLAKGYGVMGGYIAGNHALVDAIQLTGLLQFTVRQSIEVEANSGYFLTVAAVVLFLLSGFAATHE